MRRLVALCILIALAPLPLAQAAPPLSAEEAIEAANAADPEPQLQAPSIAEDTVQAEVEVTLPNAHLVEETDTEAVLEKENSFYVVREVPEGTQLLSVQPTPVIGTQEHHYHFRGYSLDALDGGWIAVRNEPYAEPIAVIEPAWAKDADGNPVATRYRIAGDTLIQEVTTTAATEFPVVADPKINQYWWGGSIDFTKSETAAIAAGGGACSQVAQVIAGLPAQAIRLFCMGVSSWAGLAMAQNKCVSARYLLTGTWVPWIRTC